MKNRRYLLTSHMIVSLTWGIIQQIIVASSTLWIIKLGRAISSNEAYLRWLILFIVSLTVVYIPSAFARLYLKKAVYLSFKKYIALFSDQFFCNPQIYKNIQLKDQKRSFLNNETWTVVDEALTFVWDLVALIANVVFNITVLGVSLNKYFILAYLFTVPLILISLHISSKWVKKISTVAQKDRASMLHLLLPVWDSVLIGNFWNFKLWKKYFDNSYDKSKSSNLKMTIIIDCITGLSMVLSLTPVLVTLVYLININVGNTALLTVIIATLPRQITTIQYLSDIVFYIAHFNSIKAKLNGLKGLLELPSDLEQYYGKIDWNNINLMNKNLELTLDQVFSLGKGRITIRGPNGCGKTSVLLMLKEKYNEKAFYLPTDSELIFESTYEKSLSTGESILNKLREIASINTSVFLLDEWDANLDTKKSKEISSFIDRLAETRKIIEVRHHY